MLFIIFTAGCNDSKQKEHSNKKTTIYTSVYPIEYIVKEIGGAHVEAISVYPPGSDGHTYEPTTKEIRDIARGEAFIYIGAGMEGFAEKARETLASQDVTFIEISDSPEIFKHVDDSHETDGHDHGGIDPHIWFDPLRMIDMAEIISAKLIEMDPENQTDYEENLDLLSKKLTRLDKEFVTTLEPKTQKHILVSHSAFGYWEERYGLTQISVSGLFNNNPSQQDLAKIAKEAKEHQIKYVLYEQVGEDRLTEVVQGHLDAEALYIHNLEVRKKEDIDQKLDYIDLMKENLEILDQATE